MVGDFMNNMDGLTEDQKNSLRDKIIETAKKCLGVPYYLGAEWVDLTKIPDSLDCSELVENCYLISGLRMPDGSQSQFNFSIPIPSDTIKRADLAFFGKGGDTSKVYHVGMVFDDKNIIEARGHQEGADFETGKVILRPINKWINYKPNFLGFRRHVKLI
jgi:cell wall-associated NlpC family hydrolase